MHNYRHFQTHQDCKNHTYGGRSTWPLAYGRYHVLVQEIECLLHRRPPVGVADTIVVVVL